MNILHSVRRRVCRREGQHLVKCQSQAVDVTAGIGLAAKSLGRHVTQRADDITRIRELAGALGLGKTEVRHPDRASHVEQQVRRLDVSMQHAVEMRVAQGLGDLHTHAGHAAKVVRL